MPRSRLGAVRAARPDIVRLTSLDSGCTHLARRLVQQEHPLLIIASLANEQDSADHRGAHDAHERQAEELRNARPVRTNCERDAAHADENGGVGRVPDVGVRTGVDDLQRELARQRSETAMRSAG